MAKILVIEDDPFTRQGLCDLLDDQGYAVCAAPDGRTGIDAFRSEKPDLICLDIMMPDMNGHDVCREIRRESTDVPVIFISAKSEEIDKVVGLELGADDYISKPFGMREVLARVRAVLRRRAPRENSLLQLGELRVDAKRSVAIRGNAEFPLGPRELQLLQYFAAHRGRNLTRQMLVEQCLGEDFQYESRVLDQQIAQLRKKVEADPHNPTIIRTVYGIGYRVE
jgi:DNA-binding response OmpR family regulator